MRAAFAAYVIGLLTIAVSILASQALGQEPVPTNAPKQHVSVAVTTAGVRNTPSTRTDALLLWNRNQRITPIGHAIKSCIRTGGGGIFGGGLMSCSLLISLPLGKITAEGVVHNLRRYTLVTTGGTGAYEGVTGPLFVSSISGDGVRRLTFLL